MADGSTKPEDEDEEAMRHMVDEMKGLRCGTNTDNAYVLDDTASKESGAEEMPTALHTDRPVPTETKPEPSTSHNTAETISEDQNSLPAEVICNVCTTIHSPPLPICCETCNNVLQPEKISNDKTWKCTSPGCDGISLGYVNFQDAGRCGICGSKRSDVVS
jgi:hypothetical protein